MITGFRICIVLAALSLCAPARAEKAVLECIADTWSMPNDRTPHGRERTLELPRRGVALLRFRTAVTEGWTLTKVTLLMHVAGGPAPAKLSVTVLPMQWTERDLIWMDIPRLRGARIHTVRPYMEGFVAIDLEPDEVGTHGILLSEVAPAGVKFESRESVGFAPYLLVEGTR